MPRFFVDKNDIYGSSLTLSGEDALHISKSLRMRVGDKITVCDNLGTDYECVIESFTKDTVTLDIVSSKESENEPPVCITLFQGIPKGDKMDTIVQKATECGVFRIYPVEMKNCIAKIQSDSAEKKIARWQKIADEAAKQSQRGRLVSVEMPISYEKALEIAATDDVSFVCYENEDKKKLSKILSRDAKSISFFVGPEGGFDVSEIGAAYEKGVVSVSLGRRILRTETAPVFVLAALSMYFELS